MAETCPKCGMKALVVGIKRESASVVRDVWLCSPVYDGCSAQFRMKVRNTSDEQFYRILPTMKDLIED